MTLPIFYQEFCMKKTVLIVIRVVCIVGFLVCAGVLGWY